MKQVVQRALAQQDIVTAFDYYFAESGVQVAADFVRAVDDCMQRIERFPEAGSPRHADLLDVEGLRFAVVEQFPYLMCYFEQADYVDVVRVLHQQQDIPALLAE